MKYPKRQAAIQWLAAFAVAATLAACGGGGGGGDPAPAVTPPPVVVDSRNGDYQMYAADARQYVLSLDFDADIYHLTGNGQDLRGTITEFNTNGKFDFDRVGLATPTIYAPQFSISNDTVVGNFRLPGGTVPFIASRSFVTTLAEAAGTYNFLTSSRDPSAASNSAIFTGELSASGQLRTCNDNTIYQISLCPAASVATATVTFTAGQFMADTGTGTVYPFRIAKVGSDRVFLRASASAGTLRRFWVGMPEGAFVDGDYAGFNTLGQATMTWMTARYDANWTDATGNYIYFGPRSALGAVSPAGIIRFSDASNGGFFGISNAKLFVAVSVRDSATLPGYVEIGIK